MNGSILVRSSSGAGTTFTITLPLFDQEIVTGNDKFVLNKEKAVTFNDERIAQYIMDEGHLKELNETINTHKDKILIVDDNDDLRSYIRSCLEDKYMLLEANNGREALSLARSKMPHLIICDIMMPGIDGLEFCRLIKSDISTSHIPVILLTAKTGVEAQLAGYHEGADEYLVKPFQKDLLMARIQNLITSRKKLREAFKSKIDIQPHDIAVTSVDEKFLNKALEIIEKNINNPDFGSPEMVSALGLSRTFVHLKFKKLTNFSTGEFIKNVRLKRAAQLLKQRKHRISEISYMVGFDNPKYFSKSFKTQFGCSPAQFIQEKGQLITYQNSDLHSGTSD